MRLLMEDPEVRRNAKLAGQLSGLPPETRRAHCLANALFLVTDPQLIPPEPSLKAQSGIRRLLAADKRTFLPAVRGNWKRHLHLDGASPAFPSAAELAKMRNKQNYKLPNIWVSLDLTEYFLALEDFWGVPGTLLG